MYMKKQLLTLLLLGAAALVKAQNPYPILSVDSVQFVNPTKLATPTANTFPDYIDPVFRDTVYRDTVRFEGVVVTNPRIYGLSTSRKAAYLQRLGGGPWSGVLVMCEPNGTGVNLATLNNETKFYENFVPGKLVRVTGVIRHFQGETQINLIRDNANWTNSIEQLALNDTTVVWHEISAKELMSGNPNTGWVQQKQTAEQWEGAPVVLRNVTVYNVTPNGANRNNWSVIDDEGNVVEIRDMSGYFRRDDNEDTIPKIANTFQPPAIGTRLDFIRGIVTEYVTGSGGGVQRYGIAPIHPTDVKVCTSCPPSVKFVQRTPVIAKATDTLNITFEITSGDTTIKARTLYYRLPGSSTIDSVNMTLRPNYQIQFTGRVNPVGTAGVFTYWVKAEDNKGRITFFPDPLTLGKSFMITDNGIDNIRVLQFSNNNGYATIWDGDSLSGMSVRGVVTTSNPFGNIITLQDGQGPNSAIFVHRSATYGTDTLKAGDSIEITSAVVRENFSTTTLYSVGYNLISRDNALPAFEMNLPLDSFINNRVLFARPWEGVLMRWDSLKITSVNPDGPTNDFGEFAFHKANSQATTGLRVDDLSANFKNVSKRIKLNMSVLYIQGPMYFANGNFKLIPRNLDDMDLSALDSIAPVITLNGNNPDTAYLTTPATPYVDPGFTATDDKDGDITSRVTVSGSVNTGVEGVYNLTYTVADVWGNEAEAKTRVVIVIDTGSVGIAKANLENAQVNLYPNPAHSHLYLTVKGIEKMPVQMAVYDVMGRELITRSYHEAEVNDQINISALQSGVYLCVVSNSQGSKTLRFVISK